MTPTASSGPTRVARGRPATVIAGCVAAIVSIAVPAITPNLNGIIARKLHTSGSELNWVGDVAFLGAVAAAYLFGSLGDRLGRRRLLILGAALTAVGEIVAGASTSIHVLWIGQGLAGIGAGGMSAISLGLVVSVARTAAERAKYVAAFTASLTAGPISSSLLGGLLASGTSYLWPYVGMAIIAAAGGVFVYLFAAESRSDAPRRMDAPGQIALILCLVALMWAVIEGAATHWGRTAIIVAFVVAAVAAVAFVVIERRPGGMVELSMFRSPSFSAAAVGAMLNFFAFIGLNYTISLRVLVGQGHSPMFSAWNLIMVGAVGGAVGFASRWALARRIGPRWLTTAGFVAYAVAGFWLSQVSIAHREFTALIGVLILIGIGQAMTIAGTSAAAVAAVPAELESGAASTQGVMRLAGPPLGLAISGGIVFSVSGAKLVGLIPHLGLPASLAHPASAVASQAGALGIMSSGVAAKSPALAHAAVGALSDGFNDTARVVAIVSLAAAAISAAFLRGATARPGEDTTSSPARQTPSAAAAVTTDVPMNI